MFVEQGPPIYGGNCKRRDLRVVRVTLVLLGRIPLERGVVEDGRRLLVVFQNVLTVMKRVVTCHKELKHIFSL